MAHILCFLFSVLTSTFRSRLSLQLEIAALRQGGHPGRPKIAPVLRQLIKRMWRMHRSLDQDAPDGRRVRLAELDQIAEFPVVQGLHHYYLPKAA